MRTRLAVSGALLIAAAVPTTAQAATLEPLKPCYVTAQTAAGPQSEGVDLKATGFTPNSKVDLAIDGVAVPAAVGLQTDAAGQLGVMGTPPQAAAPPVAKGNRAFTLTLTEQGNPANVATGASRVVALAVSVNPKRARPSRRITFRGGGFTQPKGVYAHYVYGGKVKATVRLVKQTQLCGRWKTKARQIPVANPGLGIWTVQFDQSRTYEKTPTGNFVKLGISVTRSFNRP